MPGIFDTLRLLDGPALAERVAMRAAVDALQQVLIDGFRPEDDPMRSVVDVRHGQLLLMPSDVGAFAGQKLATVAPGNPPRGLARIQAVYIVLDAETLAPVALLDGTELTNLRTPAMSAAVVDTVAPADAASLVVFGTGPQGVRHVEALSAIRPIERVRFVGRDRAKAERAARLVAANGVDAAVGSAADVSQADIVVCATTAREPLFEASLVRDRTVLVAVGSHEPDARELPGELLGRAEVIVESEQVALTEAGDVILAIAEGHLSPDALIPMAKVFAGDGDGLTASGRLATSARPVVIKTCGMGWQDLTVAQLALTNEGNA